MEFNEVVKKRRTTRQFTSEPVPKETVEGIIKAGMSAPSFDHCRKWNFIILTDPKAKAAALECIDALPCAIKEATTPVAEMIKIAFPKQKSMFEEAPVLVLPLYKRDKRIINEPVPRTHMDTAEMWCAIENIFLAATDEGLSCAMRIPTEGQPEKILAAVGCAEDFILPCMIGIGHPASNAEYPSQIYPALSDCIHWNKW